jgi:long-chain fatty acid adenylase/transferase FadD26
LLNRRAAEQPDGAAFTYVDYGHDPAGFAETLTWGEVARRAHILADELALCGSPGDRVAILAPQGMEYVVSFLGAIQAGFIAIPLSAPQYGIHDDRVSSVLRDSKPVAIITTSAAATDVNKYAIAQDGQPAPFVIEADLLDFYSARELPQNHQISSGAAYLQYTSGSSRM